MLAAYLIAPSSDLGYVPLPEPTAFSTPDGHFFENFTPLAGVLHVCPVYTAQLAGSGEEVVIKLGSQADVDREVLQSRVSSSGHILFICVRARGCCALMYAWSFRLLSYFRLPLHSVPSCLSSSAKKGCQG